MVKLQPADNHEQMQQCSFSHYASDNIKFDYQPYKTVDDTKPKWDSTNEVSLFCKRGFCCFITAMKRILYQHHTFNDKCFKIRITVYLAYNISNATMIKRSFMNNSITYLMKQLSYVLDEKIVVNEKRYSRTYIYLLDAPCAESVNNLHLIDAWSRKLLFCSSLFKTFDATTLVE